MARITDGDKQQYNDALIAAQCAQRRGEGMIIVMMMMMIVMINQNRYFRQTDVCECEFEKPFAYVQMRLIGQNMAEKKKASKQRFALITQAEERKEKEGGKKHEGKETGYAKKRKKNPAQKT
jgi:hypothetical protein